MIINISLYTYDIGKYIGKSLKVNTHIHGAFKPNNIERERLLIKKKFEKYLDLAREFIDDHLVGHFTLTANDDTLAFIYLMSKKISLSLISLFRVSKT